MSDKAADMGVTGPVGINGLHVEGWDFDAGFCGAKDTSRRAVPNDSPASAVRGKRLGRCGRVGTACQNGCFMQVCADPFGTRQRSLHNVLCQSRDNRGRVKNQTQGAGILAQLVRQCAP